MNFLTALARLNSRIIKHSNGCWEWQGSRTDQGYGKFRFGRDQLAHRVAFRLLRGPISSDWCILHRCDNPPCVNPDHLFIGDRALNNKDRSTKDRNNHHYENASHCKRGHPFDEQNTYHRKTGARMCRKCACLYQKQRNAR